MVVVYAYVRGLGCVHASAYSLAVASCVRLHLVIALSSSIAHHKPGAASGRTRSQDLRSSKEDIGHTCEPSARVPQT